MKTKELKLSQIGNSRGVRIPAETLKRYHMAASVLMEELADGIMLRAGPIGVARLSWAETALEMAASEEDWSEWDSVVADGVETIPWESSPAVVSERRASYGREGMRQKPRAVKRYDAEATVLRRLITELYGE